MIPKYAFIEYVADPKIYDNVSKLPDYNHWLPNEHIIGYRLVDTLGNIVEVAPEKCKNAFDNGGIVIVNINKIYSTKAVQRSARFNGVFAINNSLPSVVENHYKKFVSNYIESAKAHGSEVVQKSVRTGCGHKCLVTLFKHNNITDAIIEIPDNVFFLNLSERPQVFSKRMEQFNINGTVKIIGGTNLKHCIWMLSSLCKCNIDLTDFTINNKKALKQSIDELQSHMNFKLNIKTR